MSRATTVMAGITACVAAIVLVASATHAEQPVNTETTVVAPKEHRRGTEQTPISRPESTAK